jgi:hypothetical protein
MRGSSTPALPGADDASLELARRGRGLAGAGAPGSEPELASIEERAGLGWTGASAVVIEVELAREHLSLNGVASSEQAIARIEEHLRGKQVANPRQNALPPAPL